MAAAHSTIVAAPQDPVVKIESCLFKIVPFSVRQWMVGCLLSTAVLPMPTISWCRMGQVAPRTLRCRCDGPADPCASWRGVIVRFLSGTKAAQHVVARAHRVVIGLARRALLVGIGSVVGRADAVPGAVLVIDHVGPAVGP